MTEMDLSRAAWRKSLRSQQSGACVDVASNLPGIVAVRDSKDPSGPALSFAAEAWAQFTAGIKTGELELS